MGQQQRKRGRSEDRYPDDHLSAVAVACGAAQDGAGRYRRQEGEQVKLRLLYTHLELGDEVKSEVTRHGSHVKVLGKDQHQQDDDGDYDLFPRESRPSFRCGLFRISAAHIQVIPSAHVSQYHHSRECNHPKPADVFLPERHYNERRQQRPAGAACIAPYLEDGLGQAFPAPRRQVSYPRGFRVKDGGTHADEADRQQDMDIIRCKGQEQQARQRKEHSQRQGARSRVFIGVEAYNRLQQRSRQLKYEGDHPDLRKGERIILLQKRVHRRDNRLDNIIQQMGKTNGEQDRIYGLRTLQSCRFCGSWNARLAHILDKSLQN